MRLSKKIKFALISFGFCAAAAIPLSISLVSCSNSEGEEISSNKFSDQVKYDVNFKTSNKSTKSLTIDRPTILPVYPSDGTTENNVDPNFNNHALLEFLQLISSKFGEEVSNTTKQLIEKDLNDVVLDFLSVVESETSKTELELAERDDVDKVITLNKATIDKDFFNSKKISLNLTVKCEEEQENNRKENTNIVSKTFDFDVYVEFVGTRELLGLVEKINNPDSNISGTQNVVEFEDLKEIFLGDNFKQDKDGWKNSFKYSNTMDYDYEESTLQDRGLINYVASFQNKYSSNAKMLGYTFNIADFWNKLSNQSTKNTVSPSELTYWAPSTSLNKIFVPNFQSSEYDLEINIKNFIESENCSSFESSYDFWKNEITNKSVKEVYELFKKIAEVNLPEDVVSNLENVIIDPKQSLEKNENDYEIIFQDKNKNRYEFEIYKTWWA